MHYLQQRIFYISSLPLAVCFLLAMHVYIPNMGGTGLALPLNLTAWLSMAAVVLTTSVSQLQRQSWVGSPVLKWLVVGGVLYTLPLLWSEQRIWQQEAQLRVLAVWGGIAFYYALLQLPLRATHRRLWMALIIIATLQESLLSLLQLWVFDRHNWMEYDPRGGRPFAIFQQINVLGSFVATGYAAAILLWLRSRSPRARPLSAAALTLLPFILVITQSRIAWVGAIAVILGYTLLQWRNKQLWYATALSALGTGSAWLYQTYIHGEPSIEKSGSDTHRLELLRVAVQMIMERPLQGWGYGSYSWHTAHYPGWALDAYTLNHPHNELLYGWMEGGLIALAAMLMIAFAAAIPLFSRRWRSRMLWWLPMLPIALHTQTELVLYQSAVHWMTLIALLRLATPKVLTTPHRASRMRMVSVHGPGVVAAGLTMVFVVTGYQTQAQLTQQERRGFSDSEAIAGVLNPWSTPSRWAYDYHTALLQRFNHTQAPELLERYLAWGGEYVLAFNNPNVYADMLAITRHQLQFEEAEHWRKTAQVLFPTDTRFSLGKL
ncbi:PglL family O-oligosaccharyltransferase [Pseudomonas fontis]|uniref:Wzy polymerase domain-containing protein n=1 Tax=Pseudomonas fontis TaxID=2942633 RepID=A0ABT5NQ61_9PSED|nr:Wzy polymerase domain-containing protein [Pseudomonas fontis]MDD0972841.1 Wzy polymerase domain-containing protein [Pseudomonas fontis]MDD0990298.1 Wzy polymerase domain-containing protein [Pseudomonas fontis]